MQISNDFVYNRKFFIRDLSRPNVIFSRCSQLEFDSFDSFIKNYLSKDQMILSVNGRLIIPITDVGQLDSIKDITNNHVTFVFYIKYINENILTELSNLSTNNMGLLVDYINIDSFETCLNKLPKDIKFNLCKKIINTKGIFRITLNKDNLKDLIDNITLSFLRFPYFSHCDLNIEYHTFEDCKLSELHEIIFKFKSINKSFITNKYRKHLNWKFYNEKLSERLYRLTFLPNNGSGLYIYNDKVSLTPFDSELPNYSCDLLSQDGNNIDRSILDKFLAAVHVGFNCNLFVSKYENYLCNNTISRVPYLNKILNNIIDRGDI